MTKAELHNRIFCQLELAMSALAKHNTAALLQYLRAANAAAESLQRIDAGAPTPKLGDE